MQHSDIHCHSPGTVQPLNGRLLRDASMDLKHNFGVEMFHSFLLSQGDHKLLMCKLVSVFCKGLY